jgi:hypothetical protein
MRNSSVLDLTLDTTADGYQLQMRFSASGQDVARESAWWPFKLNRAALLQQALNPEAYGETLYQLLFGEPKAAAFFRECRAASGSAPIRWRLRLRPETTELNELRWETLRDPEAHLSLTMGEQLLFSRYLFSEHTPAVRLSARTELRALVAIASPENLPNYQLAPVIFAEERQRALQALGDIPTQILGGGPESRATLPNLSSCLREGYDILYLVCHGQSTKNEAETVLWLEDEHGAAARATGQELIERIQELPELPRLVVLLACQSAKVGTGPALMALGPRLSLVGVSAVIAMQDDLTLATGAQFMPEFFRELRRDGQIDRAFALARGAVRRQADAWVPALFLRSESGRLWADNLQQAAVEASTGIRTLAQLAEHNPFVREKVSAFRTQVEIASQSIDELGDYKDLHDLLHQTQFGCYNRLKEQPTPRDVDEALVVLEDLIPQIEKVAQAGRVPAREMGWLAGLADLRERLRAAARLADNLEEYTEPVEQARDGLQSLLARIPSRINDRLNHKAGDLDLKRLAESLTAAQASLVDTVGPPVLSDLATGLRALNDMNTRLTQLVDGHQLWQLLVDELQLAESQLEPGLKDLAKQWPKLREMTEACCRGNADDAARNLLDDAALLEKTLAEGNEYKTRLIFDRFLSRANKSFSRLDSDLKNACDQLRQLGASLTQLLQSLTTP